MTNEAATEVYAIDVLGLAKKASDLPLEQHGRLPMLG
jgi:hypothetical protein